MNSVFSYRATIDLRTKQNEVFWDTIANVGDKSAHQFVLDFIDVNGHDVDLTGAVVGLYCIRPDNETVIVDGHVENNCAVAALNDQCYAYTGRVKCTVTVSKDGTMISAVRVWITIGVSSTDAIVDPGEVIPSLPELLAEIATMRQATAAATTAVTNANNAASNATNAASQAGTAAQRANTAAGTANTAAQNANSAASSITGMTVSATKLPPGSNPTAAISDVDGHKHVAFGLVTGDTGAKGDFSRVESTTVYYQNSQDGSTIPTGTWLPEQPATPQGYYLWMKIHRVWTSGQATDDYSVSRMGMDGTGSVRSVMNISPDDGGNISLQTAVSVIADTLRLTFT